LRATLNLRTSGRDSHNRSPICVTSALEGKGIAEFLDLLEEQHAKYGDEWIARRQQRFKQEIEQAVLEEAQRRLAETLRTAGIGQDGIAHILQGKTTVSELATRLLHLGAQDTSQHNEGTADERKSEE